MRPSRRGSPRCDDAWPGEPPQYADDLPAPRVAALDQTTTRPNLPCLFFFFLFGICRHLEPRPAHRLSPSNFFSIVAPSWQAFLLGSNHKTVVDKPRPKKTGPVSQLQTDRQQSHGPAHSPGPLRCKPRLKLVIISSDECCIPSVLGCP